VYSTAFLDIPALATADGVVRLPGSKSISNRALLLAALCEGDTVLHDVLDSDDTRVMVAALGQLGCNLTINGNTIHLCGLGGHLPVASAKLFLGNAGTAMRPLAAALAMLGGDFELSGVPRMHERPIGDLVEALVPLGCAISYAGNPGYPPLRIGKPNLDLNAPIRVRGDVSSQFLTALLMALPLVATRDIRIEVIGELISKPYIEITLNLLARFGVQIQREGWAAFVIPANSRLRSPGTLHVESDASSASYFLALGAIASRQAGQMIRIEGLGVDSIQGDIRFIEAARAMGADIQGGSNWLTARTGNWPLRAIDLDCNHIPDAAMTLAVMALYADGPCTLRNIASWRVKETDRIAAMATELRKLGATVVEGPDFIRVHPLRSIESWKPGVIETYDDHRIAMCFSLAAFNPAQLPVRIEDPKCVGKTFPDYFESLFDVAHAVAVPVICVDGPTASGKGTLSSEVARALGYRLLDSGVLYRAAGLVARRQGLTLDRENEASIAQLALRMDLNFSDGKVFLGAEDISDAVRTEQAGLDASAVSALGEVRSALLEFQLAFRRLPGLVADGRDMGTVVYPDALLKIYLTASASQRAERRYKQLISKGIAAKLDSLCRDLEERDARDTNRSIAPLKPAQDAVLLDNSHLNIEESVQAVLKLWQGKQPFRATPHG
jgi:3-phosphoshikimate 1-carboxyvinyltransferase